MSSESAYNQAVALGKAWLATCLENHPSCAKKARHAHIFCSDNNHFITDLSGDGLVPSRLLKFPLHSSADGVEGLVRLVLSAELDEHTQYVALSHCWGSLAFRPLQTLSTNIDSHVNNGIRLIDLPKTYREAIEITRGMGYEHLWIDSLCIIQDSTDDWKREARRMAIIYDNAILTIAAMDARNSSQGLFPGNEGRVNGLESRAWTCQERMVAPRTLNFTRRSVAWECRQGTASAESESLQHSEDESLTDYDKENWVPPTRPKAMFRFFRDWRLPPKDPKDEHCEPTESTMMTANAATEASDLRRDGSFRSALDNIDKQNNHPTDDSHTEVCEESSLHNVSDGEASVQGARSEISAHAVVRLGSSDIVANPSGATEENKLAPNGEVPPWVWSDDTDAAFKEWNVRPPPGESGVWMDHESQTIFTFIGSDMPAHAAQLLTQTDYPIEDQRWVLQYDEPWGREVDPFGQFQVFVRDLMRPKEAYEPFVRVWWNLVALYTPRTLTYDSDAFLAINGIPSVAQRWTHLRNTFGLWLNFFENELCWYIDPEVPARRPESPEWLVPSWSWASTRQGRVKNVIYREWESVPILLIKPEIRIPVGTAFDMPLPMEAWRQSHYHETQLKGSLRKAGIRRLGNPFREHDFEITVEAQNRYSDHEVYRFFPDVAGEFTIGDDLELGHHLDVMLVLHPIWYDYWIENYNSGTLPEDVATDERTMRRLGLLEVTYGLDQQRDREAIREEWMWKHVRIL